VISVFFPYYQCGDKERQKEIDLCLSKNAENALIDNLFVVIDDGCECPVESSNIRVININTRLTYKKWIEMTAQYCTSGITVLCNSDIYFDESLCCIHEVLKEEKSFIALSRWELLGGSTSKHPNPHWSQDTWAMNVGEELSPTFMHQLDFPMGVPRCDNKIAYLFAVQGWKVYNPVDFLKSIHAHETQMRTYHKKLDDRILGGAAYVYPGATVSEEAKLDFDVWTKRTSQINKVAINKAMEKWIREAKEQEAKAQETDQIKLPAFVKASAQEVLQALNSKTVVASYNTNFEVLEHNGDILFKNAYQLNKVLKLNKDQYNQQPKAFNAAGLIPPVMSTYTDQIGTKAKNPDDLNFWQYPCATEKQAYENHLSIKPGEHIDLTNKTANIYVPLPWATYVDKKAFPEAYLARIQALITYYKTIAEDNGFALKVHSVCQHIHWIRMLEMAQQIGITDFHLSHKDSTSEGKQKEVGTTLTLHGWPLIAVNYVTPDRSEGMERKPMSERKLLASFIGAHMPHYRDDSRIKLFEAAKECGRDDVFVDLGNEWHFNKVVYEEQVLNREVEAHHIDEHHQKTFRYNSILSDSKFSLCPEGAGPNTLRFWESIAVGSIPVIFSDDLAAFSELSFGQELLANVVLWNNEVGPELFSKLIGMSSKELKKRSDTLIEIYTRVAKSFAFKRNYIIDGRHASEKKPEVNAAQKNIKILYVGASVTAQKNGYRPELNTIYQQQGFNVKQEVIATGATGSLFGLCNLNELNQNSFNLGIYEYSTGDLNIGLTPLDKVYDTVKSSLLIMLERCTKVVVVHNYRSDFEGKKGDVVRSLYNRAAEELGIPILNIYKEIEIYRKSFEGEWANVYRDNVHSGELGSRLVAQKIFEGIKNSDTPPVSLINMKLDRNSLPRIYNLNVTGIPSKKYTYPASGQIFEYLELKNKQKIHFEMRGKLLGIIPIVGPRSGWIKLELEGKTVLNYCLFDRHCHYTRVQPRHFEYEADNFVACSLSLTDQNVDVSLCSKTHSQHSSSREISISGFMGQGVEIKNIRLEE